MTAGRLRRRGEGAEDDALERTGAVLALLAVVMALLSSRLSNVLVQ
jgi:hypothetical protein